MRAPLAVLLLVLAPVLVPLAAAGQALMPPVESSGADTARLTIFADGTARRLLTDGATGGNDAGSGSFGAILATTNWKIRLNVNAAASADSITAAAGSFVLNPSVGTSSGSLDLERVDALWGFTVRGYASIATTTWADSLAASNSTVIGVGALLAADLNGRDDENDVYSMRFQAGLSYRSIGGDISDEDALRLRMLGSTDQVFLGLEGGAQASLRNVTAGIGLYYLFDPDEGQIDGLTRFQATFAINIHGPLMTKDILLSSPF